MGLSVKKGAISNLSMSTKVIGRNGNTNTVRCYTFRIENTSLIVESPVNMDIAENDKVTVVGEMKQGTFKVYSFRNDNTGATTKANSTFILLFGICFTILGFLTMIILVGFVLLPLGIFLIYKSTTGFKANNLLKIS